MADIGRFDGIVSDVGHGGWITIAEASQLVDRPARSLRRWAKEGLVGSVKSGGVWLVNEDDVLRVATEGPGLEEPRSFASDPHGTLEQVWTRVEKELERDQLPDIIDHLDFGANRSAEFERIINDVTSGYVPDDVRVVEMPKTTLGSRPLAVLSIEDRLLYESCVQTIAPSIDAVLHENVYNDRLLHPPRARQLTRHFSQSFRMFEQFVSKFAASDKGARVCVKTDISSFYEYVDHDVLLSTLETDVETRPALSLLGILLKGWRASNGAIGLPQGPSISGILANAYLLDADAVCAADGLAYARYADDFRVFFRDKDEARRFMPRLIGALRGLQLNLSAAKTEIVTVEDLVSDLRGQRRAYAHQDAEHERVESLDDLHLIFDDATEHDAVEGTDFRFSVWRLGLLEDDYALRRVLECLPESPYVANVAADYFARLGDRPLVRDLVKDYLLSSDNVHEWVEIHLLRLVGLFDEVDPHLLKLVRGNAFGHPGLVGDFSARVLGAVGTPADRRRLRSLASSRQAHPSRRRAAAVGGSEGQQVSDRQWVRRFLSEDDPQVQRISRYLLAGHALPNTLPLRRTPPWAERLRRKLQRQGKLPVSRAA